MAKGKKQPDEIEIDDDDAPSMPEGSEGDDEVEVAEVHPEPIRHAPASHVFVRADKVSLEALNRRSHEINNESEISKARALEAATKALEGIFKKV